MNNDNLTVLDMNAGIIFPVLLLCSYLLGCISTGYYMVKIFTSEDIRDTGSGSTGATNVGRILGKKGFIITVVIDVLKGILIAILCRVLKFSDVQCLLSIIALVCGHIWPVQLKFQGGKGISVIMGFFFIWNFYMLLTLGIVLFLSYMLLKSFKIAGLISILVFPVYAIAAHFELKIILLLVFLTGIVYFAHRENIRNFINTILSRK